MKCGTCGQINVHEAVACDGCGRALEDWNPQATMRKAAAPPMRAAPPSVKAMGGGFFSRSRPRAGVIPVGPQGGPGPTATTRTMGRGGLANAGIAAAPLQMFDKLGKLQSTAGSNMQNAGITAAPLQTFDKLGKLQSTAGSNMQNAGISAAPRQTFDTQGKLQSTAGSNMQNAGIAAAPRQTFDTRGKLQSTAGSNMQSAGIAATPRQTIDIQGRSHAGVESNMPTPNVAAKRGPVSRREAPASRPYVPPGARQDWAPPAQPPPASQTSPGGVEGWTTPPPGSPSWSRSSSGAFTPPAVPTDLSTSEVTDASATQVYDVASAYRGLLRSYGVGMACYFFFKILGNVPTAKAGPGLGLLSVLATLILIGAVIVSIYNGMRLAGPIGCTFHPALLIVFLVFPMASIFVVGALLFTSFPWLTARGVKMDLLGPDDATLKTLKAKASTP